MSVFTDKSRFSLQHHDGRIRVWRPRGERLLNCYVLHRHSGPAPGIMVWGGIGFHCRTHLLRIGGTLNSQPYISEMLEPVVLPYNQHACHQPYSNGIMRDHTWNAMFKSSFPIRLNFFLSLLVLPIYHQSKACGPCLHNDWAGIYHPLLHQINCGNMWKSHGMLHPKDTSK
ncbi:transposable element Tcb1 transposase [Trichonephila clavipes]|nr:transposable element Tcb1 transposase [Trichonephila clavipes]